MTTAEQRRLIVALRWLLQAETEEQEQARTNAKIVLESINELDGFIPDEYPGCIDEWPIHQAGNKKGATADVYTDGVWQPDLIAELNSWIILSEIEIGGLHDGETGVE